MMHGTHNVELVSAGCEVFLRAEANDTQNLLQIE